MTFFQNTTGRPLNRRWYVTTLATYLAAPLVAALAVVLVAFVEAYPGAAIVSGIVIAALIGPSLDIWRRRTSRLRRNDERAE